MGNQIKNYIKYIDDILNNNSDNMDWKKLLENHKIQISFFQHERLIHLLVTLFFALFSLLIGVLFFFLDNLIAGIIFIILLIMDIFYVKHYYLLENSVQHMYDQYNKIYSKIK